MTVYVDQTKDYTSRRLKYTHFCHMFADSPAELLAMATRIGLNPSWLQIPHGMSSRAHFDVTPSIRRLAIRYGAEETTTKEWLRSHRPTQ